MRPWLLLRRWLVVAVSQRLLAQECTDDTNARDGDPRWCIHALAASKLPLSKAGSKVELASSKTLANSRPEAASLLRIVLGLLVHAGDRFRLYSSLLRLSPNRGIVAAQGVFIP